MKTMRIGRKQITYTILAVLLASIVLLAASPLLGLRFDVVLSGSMSPAIRTGDLIMVNQVDPNDLKVGDVIVFHSPFGGLVCHRIIAVNTGEEVTYQTKGDNNEDPDPFVIESKDVVGRVQVSMPLLGYVVQWLRGPFGLVAIIALIAAALLLPEKGIKEEKKEKPKEDMNA